MTYADWNEAIARRFFNEQNAGRKVFLCVDDALLIQLGGADGKADFIAAIKRGPESARRPELSICTQARRTWEEWRKRPQGFPAYLGYLGFFVLAASQEGERETGYYKRLHRLLGEEATNRPPPCFYEMWPLWDDLEDWANDVQGGKFGIVSCDFAGAWPHVGLPRAQIVLTERERAKLPELFAAAELDSAAPPASEELAQLARKHGAGRLETRTMRRLAREGEFEEEMRSLTLEALLDELRSWDGSVEAADGITGGFHSLRWNLRIKDRLSGIADARIVVRDAPSLPDGDMIVVETGGTHKRLITKLNEDWLTLKESDGTPINTVGILWPHGLRVAFDRMVFRLTPRRVRVLRRGEFDRIEGLVEVNRLDPHREFYVLVCDEAVIAVDRWGQRAGRNWKEITLRTGLPHGFRLFRADSADPAIAAPAEFPVLKTDPLVRVLFKGGIKTEPMGRRYFDFAPPDICVEGLAADNVVKINGIVRPIEAGDVTIVLGSSELQPSNRVSVLMNDEEIRVASFQIAGSQDLPWKRQGEWATRQDGSAISVTDSAPKALGAAVSGFVAPPVVIATERGADLIGPQPGQIVTLPGDAVPADWTPVWLIEHGRGNRRVIFCGSDPAKCSPVSASTNERRRVREWKRVLWNERKQLAGPTRGPLVLLWRKFKEAAEHE